METAQSKLQRLSDVVSKLKVEFEPDLEDELLDIVSDFAETDSVSEEDVSQLEPILLEIAEMKLSTAKCRMYIALKDSRLPCAEKVLRHAVYHEPYYNCTGDATQGYITLAVSNSDISEDVKSEFKKQFEDSLVGELAESSQDVQLPDELMETLEYAATCERDGSVRYNAYKAVVFFNIKGLVDPIQDFLKRKVGEELEDPCKEYGIKGISYHLNDILYVALILQHLTKDDKYSQVIELIKERSDIDHKNRYTDYEQVNVLHGKIRDIMGFND
jgi:hypothetical protein